MSKKPDDSIKRFLEKLKKPIRENPEQSHQQTPSSQDEDSQAEKNRGGT
jgi:hypothetical protein